MKSIISAIVFLLVSSAFAAKPGKDKEPSIDTLRENLFQKSGLFFSARGTSTEDYAKILKGLFESEAKFAISDGIVSVGERFSFKPYLEIGPDGPEYSNDNLLAIRLETEVDSSQDPEKIAKYLSELPVDDELKKFVKSNFTDSDRFIKEGGLDLYQTILLSSISRYPSHTGFLMESLSALKKYPDQRIVPFLEQFRKENVVTDPDLVKAFDDLSKEIAEKSGPPSADEKPPLCESLAALAEKVAKGKEKAEAVSALETLGKMTCKEAVAYLFFLKNFSYISQGDNLFGNDDYFDWDKKNMRYSMDLKRKGELEQDITKAWINMLSNLGVPLTEALKILSSKYSGITVGVDSIYFDYMFRLPYRADWELTKKEFYSLLTNMLFTESGYSLKKSYNVRKIVKAR